MEQSKALTIFNFEEQEIRTTLIDDKPWFIAADVCAILEHSDVSMAVRRLDDDEKGTSIVCTLGGNQSMLCVNESGLYHLIFTSRKEEAKIFRHWVTQEVLPSIRKTGFYDSTGRMAALVQKHLALFEQHQAAVTFLVQGLEDDIDRGADMLNPKNNLIQDADLEDWMRLYLRLTRIASDLKTAKKITAIQYQEMMQVLNEGLRVVKSHLTHLDETRPIADGIWEKAYYGTQEAKKQQGTLQAHIESLRGDFLLALPPQQTEKI